ncbi:MAG TPA: GNAT family N-acetyltransferase [Sphingomicrobium sp.]|nr:GNAT family N-acetyltransferase [Sphingomicrobium sp.]
MEIRRLREFDLAELKAMNRLFAEVFDEPEIYLPGPPDAYLERLAGRDEFIALAASIEGKLAGGLVAYELIKLEQQRSEIYVYDLAVHDAFRRRGVATSLIEALKAIARECGAWMIFVQADPPDAPAVALYEGLGRREDVLHFDISPDADRPAR